MISTIIAGGLVEVGEEVVINNTSQTVATINRITEEGTEIILHLDNGFSEIEIESKYCKVKV